MLCASAFAALLAVSVFAETTKVVENGQYVITVPEGESHWLPANEEATFHDYDLVKKGKGRLCVGSAVGMASFSKNIYIYEGIYESSCVNGLGSEEAVTYVDGGTFQNALMQGKALSKNNFYTSISSLICAVL